MKPGWLVRLFWRIHPLLYRRSGGRIGGRLRGLPVLLLTTTGRRSGQPRTKALMYLPHGDALVVIASNLGAAQHPHWWLNLRADSRALVQVGAERFAVRAREAEGEAREAIWRALVARQPAYDEYRGQTTRRIPVVVLEKEGGGG